MVWFICSFQDGAILAFLPGWGEISDLNKLLEADPMFKSGKDSKFIHLRLDYEIISK